MIKLKSIKNLYKSRNCAYSTIYNLIGIEDNQIENYVGYTTNLEERLKSHYSKFKWINWRLSFDNLQHHVVDGMVNSQDVSEFRLNDNGFFIRLRCGYSINYKPSNSFTEEDEKELYFGMTAKLRKNKRYPEKLTFAEKSRSLYLVKGRYIPKKSRGLRCLEIAESVSFNTMTFINNILNIPMQSNNYSDMVSKNKSTLISLKVLYDSLQSLKFVKLA